ncbi:MAG: flagellar hook-basal body complex protein [Alphaproteobacteria bacterium]|nr:flagellar hook-basal body complex protein [Alphaproteobacteria bacterium]
MSLYSALRSGVSGLFSQTQAMSMISDNITNVNTTGYKAVRARFSSLVGSSSQGSFSAGVVSAIADRSVARPGQVTSSTTNTHVAVNGQGFFAVSKADDVTLDRTTGTWKTNGEVLYTRAGDFSTDANGNLRNAAGYVLLGWERNASNTGYNVSNLVSEFTAVNVAGTVGQPLPTQAITMNANLNASLKEGKSFTMTAPMYSRQGGISNIEYRFTKVGDGISKREFIVEARLTSGAAQLINKGNALAASGGRTVGGTAKQIEFYGVQFGTNSRQIQLNYGGDVELSGTAVSNFKVEYSVSGVYTVLDAGTIEIRGGKVTVTLSGDIPSDAQNLQFFQTGGSPLRYKRASAPASPVIAGTGTLTIPALGTVRGNAAASTGGHKFTGYYDIGKLSFDASGLNPTLTAPDAVRTATAGYYQAGTVALGELSILVDHSSDGESATLISSDDVKIAMNFAKSGASAGMTSYESASTIYSIDQDGNSSGDLQSVQFNARGELQAIFSRGAPKYLAQIPLMSFNNPNSLLVADGNAYKATDSAGVGVSRVAGTGDSGTVAGASLEASNADIATEFTEMIVVQRAYSAATKIITTADEMLDEVIRAKR